MKEVVKAYWREERKVYGIRNHVLILPTTACVNRIAEIMWEEFKNVSWGENGENRVVLARHSGGCTHVGFDEEIAFNALLGLGSHPNIYGVLLVSLGCGQFCKRPLLEGEDKRENLAEFKLYDRLVKRGVKTYWVNIQEKVMFKRYSTSLEQAIDLGKRFVRKMVSEAESMKRQEASLSHFVVGIGNGASDPTSGLFTNAALGYVVDHFIRKGGTVVFSQTIEMLGAEGFIFRKIEKSRRRHVYRKIKRLLETATVLKEALQEYLGESDPTPGNIRSGISTLAEKSLGTMLKIGHDPNIAIRDVLYFGEKIPRNGGLYLMDSPGMDIFSISGMVAGGAHLVVFTTGMGTPVGSVVSPVIKVTTNKETFEKMPDIIDVYIPIERIFEKGERLKDLSINILYPRILEVMSGETLSLAERRGQMDFDIRCYWLRA